jgi:YHS domain-containing protein
MRMHVIWQRPCLSALAALSFAILTILSAGAAWAGSPVNTGYFEKVAIMGYDPVAYFTDGRATKGSEEFAYDWLGATWQFANAEHRDAFAATPIRYAPQYGGLCALGVVRNERSVNVDPEAWRIVDGKLYLFFGKAGLEQDWDPNPAAVVAKADANWPAIEAKLAAR